MVIKLWFASILFLWFADIFLNGYIKLGPELFLLAIPIFSMNVNRINRKNRNCKICRNEIMKENKRKESFLREIRS